MLKRHKNEINKSSIIELCEWIERNSAIGNPFAGANRKIYSTNVTYNASYMDIMLYKKGTGQSYINAA